MKCESFFSCDLILSDWKRLDFQVSRYINVDIVEKFRYLGTGYRIMWSLFKPRDKCDRGYDGAIYNVASPSPTHSLPLPPHTNVVLFEHRLRVHSPPSCDVPMGYCSHIAVFLHCTVVSLEGRPPSLVDPSVWTPDSECHPGSRFPFLCRLVIYYGISLRPDVT